MTPARSAGARSGSEIGRRAVSAGTKQEVHALYTFDCRRADGSPTCLEAHELSSDAAAVACARKLLAEHPTCSNVEVFDGERPVGTVARGPGLEPLATGEDDRTFRTTTNETSLGSSSPPGAVS